MSFWDNYVMLCKTNGTTPNAVTKALGYSNATATKWKNGSVPSGKTLKKISEHFGVTVDSLLDIEGSQTEESGNITDRELIILKAYRSHPEMHTAIEKLLGVQGDGDYVRIYTAAKSEDNHPDEIIDLPKEEWENIKNAPDTDESLI